MSSASGWIAATVVIAAGSIATKQFVGTAPTPTTPSVVAISDLRCDDGPPVKAVLLTTTVAAPTQPSGPGGSDAPASSPNPQPPPKPVEPRQWSKFNDAEYQALGLPTPPGVPHVDVPQIP